MKYKKSIILLVLAVFIISMSCVWASDAAMAGDDNTGIGQTIETTDGEMLSATDDETVSVENDLNELSTDPTNPSTFSELSTEIGSGGNVELDHDYYSYDSGSTINITIDESVIDGKGAVIDMAGSTIQPFTVTAYGVTFKNLIIKNANYNGDGGVVYFHDEGTVANCNFTGNEANGYGGAVYFRNQGTVSNCSFTGNEANGYGGAVYFRMECTVSNCNFSDNRADAGGAVYFRMEGTVSNCSFTGNEATGNHGNGGAIYFDDDFYCLGELGNVTNCNFADNSAKYNGGAIYTLLWPVTADTCIFKTGSDTTSGDVSFLSPTLDVDNFTTSYGSGEKLTFDLKTNRGMHVDNGNISISVYYKNNDSWFGNYSCLSGEGWAVDLPVGSYYAVFDTEYEDFTEIRRTITITPPNYTFWALNHTINVNDASEVNLTNDYYYYSAYDEGFANGVVINRTVTINGNGHSIDAKGKARVFYIEADNVVIKNLTIKNANYDGDGGAIYFNNEASSGSVENCNFTDNTASYRGGAVFFSGSGTVENCNFTNNKATDDICYGGAIYFNRDGTVTNCNFTNNSAKYCGYGGAIRFKCDGNVTNCNFTNNTARYGGAIEFDGTGNVTNCNFTNNTAGYNGGAVFFFDNGTVTNCNFTGNNATNGSAIYFCKFHSSVTLNISDSTFLNNRANAEALDVVKNDNNITITFTGKNNLLNAIYSRNDAEVTFTNVTYWGANGIANTGSSPTTPSRSNKATGQNITVGVVVNGNLVLSDVMVTDENGTIVLNINAGDNYYITACHDTDSYYTEAEKTISNMTFTVNVTSQTTTNKTVNITAKSDIPQDILQGKLLFILPNGDEINATYAADGIWWAVHTFDGAGDYNINASYTGLDNVTINTATVSIRYDARVVVQNKTLDLFVGDEAVIVVTTVPIGLNYSIVPDDSGVYSLKDGVVIALREGTGNVLVKLVDNGGYAENSTEIAVTVSKVPTEIGIENDTLKLEVTDEVATGVTLTPADAGNVTYAISNSSVVEVKDGKIIALAEGEATITVSFAGDKKYVDAENKTIAVNVTLKDTSISLNNSTLDLFIGDNFTIVAATNPAGLNVSFVPDDSGVYSVDENGTVTALREGTGNILVKFGGKGIYAENSTEISVTVSKVPTEIKIASPTGEMSAGAMAHVAAELNPSKAGNLTYTSNDTSVANVSETGVIKANMAGTALITVSFAGNDNYAAAENKTIAVTVNLNDASISVNNSTLDLFIGDNFTIVAATSPAGLNVTFVPDDSGVYSVDENGTVIALREGTGNILVKFGGDGVYAENSTEVTVTVSKIATEITLTNETIELKPHKSIGDLASLSPAEAGNLTYTSSDEDIVLVSEEGVIYARIKGTATVTVSFAGDNKYKAAENRTITVNVTLNDASVSVENDTIDLNVDDTCIINATANPRFLTVYYASSNESVATVTDHGNVKAVGEGTAIITLTVGNGETYAVNSTNVTVTVSKVPTEITIDSASLDLYVGDETVIVANLTPAGAGNVTFTSSDDAVVTVDAQGNVIAEGKGQAIITVSFAGDDKYAAAENKTITVTVSLNDASITVDNDTLDLKVGETYKINATKNPDTIMLDITYTSGNSSVVRVDENGIVTAVGEGSAIITVEVGDDEIYAKNSTSITVTVNKLDANATVSIPENVTVGDNSTVNVKLPSDATGNVTLKADGEVVSTVPVTNGTASVGLPKLSAGNHTVEIAYSGDEKYNPVSETKDITVSKHDTAPEIAVEGSNVDVKLPGDATGNVTVKVDDTVVSTVPVTNGTASVKLPKLSAGNHTVEIAYSGDGKYNPSAEAVTVSIDKNTTNLTADNVTATYNVKKYLTITLTDSSGSPIANATVSVKLKSLKNYITDENGQIKVKVSSLVPKTYAAEITFKGDDNYAGSNATAKVTVKKAASKITAKAKTFKTTTKTKKYTVTLKNSKGKALKNKTVYLKVKGKNYKAKTNSKGKATFKITKLSKAGKFQATVTFKGNDYYKKATKKVKITVKSAFKTISKGSKKHATVKKIQRALKSNGYYLSYNGHYLKVDGIYQGYTEMAVKQFQKAKGLKVTGKVDEKTAKKLKII